MTKAMEERMANAEECVLRGIRLAMPTLQGEHMILMDEDVKRVAKKVLEERGYSVDDHGFYYWVPEHVFKSQYRLASAMTFGDALQFLKRGRKVARAGWNGKGVWLTLIRAGDAMHMGMDMQDCIGMRTATGVMQPGWLASQEDMLAEDWTLVD